MSILKLLINKLDKRLERKTLSSVQQSIDRHFNFLLDIGYIQRSLNYYKGYGGEWRAIFDSQNEAIHIFSDRGGVSIMFEPFASKEKKLFSLEAIIFYLSKEKIFIGEFDKNVSKSQKKQIEKLALLLSEYIETIKSYFANEYQKHIEDLILSQKKYSEIYWDKYIRKKEDIKVWDWD